MKILGIDYGKAKIGLAISEGQLAKPLGVVGSEDQVVSICQRSVIEKVVIGISEGITAQETRNFGDKLAKITGLPVEYYDEALSSQKAKEIMVQAGKPRMKKKKAEHSISAAIILQDYLDSLG